MRKVHVSITIMTTVKAWLLGRTSTLNGKARSGKHTQLQRAAPGSRWHWPRWGARPPTAEDGLSRAQEAVSLRYPPSVPLQTSSDEHVLTFCLQTKITAGIKHINRSDSRNTESVGLVTKATSGTCPHVFPNRMPELIPLDSTDKG